MNAGYLSLMMRDSVIFGQKENKHKDGCSYGSIWLDSAEHVLSEHLMASHL